MAFLLEDVKKVDATVAFVDGAGNPAKVDGAPVWASSDETIVTVVGADDGFSAVITAVGPLGTAQVSCKADALVGEGVEELLLLADVEVVGSKAVAGTVSFGTPVPK